MKYYKIYYKNIYVGIGKGNNVPSSCSLYTYEEINKKEFIKIDKDEFRKEQNIN